MESQGASGQYTTRTIGRRSLAKGVAWSVPLASVVATSPAYAACSGPQPNLTFSPFSASYVNGANAGSARPDLLDVNFTITNTGNQATTGLSVTLKIPANLHNVAPTSPANPAGWVGTGVWTGSLGAGWTSTFTAVSQLPGATGSLAFSTRVTFNDTADPFRAWDGNAFTLGATAAVTNRCHLNGSGAAAVAASVNSTLVIDGTVGDMVFHPTNSDRNTLLVRNISAIRNSGRRTTGQVTLTVSIPQNTAATSWFNAQPGSPATAIASGWSGGVRTGPTTGPWVYTFTSTPTALAPDPFVASVTDDRTSAFSCTIPLLSGGNPGTPNVDVTITVSASGADPTSLTESTA